MAAWFEVLVERLGPEAGAWVDVEDVASFVLI
jgi:hypothetical protein